MKKTEAASYSSNRQYDLPISLYHICLILPSSIQMNKTIGKEWRKQNKQNKWKEWKKMKGEEEAWSGEFFLSYQILQFLPFILFHFISFLSQQQTETSY